MQGRYTAYEAGLEQVLRHKHEMVYVELARQCKA